MLLAGTAGLEPGQLHAYHFPADVTTELGVTRIPTSISNTAGTVPIMSASLLTGCCGGAGANPYTMPYSFLLQSFAAPDLATGWFDAAEIYRTWALREATWMQPGTLKDKIARGTFPQWLVETPLWIQLNPYAVRS